VPATTSYATNGNNGTIKIHEQGTPSGTQSNDPKVCTFNVEGFGFDASQTGYVKFDVQGGDKPTGVNAGPYAFGPTSSTGYYATQYFHLQPGHYKATLYGKQLPTGALTDVKAKSKVFKVTCSDPTTPTTTPTGHVLGDNTPTGSTAELPAVLPSTGPSAAYALVPVIGAATYATAYLFAKKKSEI
jgi:hypothetical protein